MRLRAIKVFEICTDLLVKDHKSLIGTKDGHNVNEIIHGNGIMLFESFFPLQVHYKYL